MNIFIAWSGATSKAVAKALYDWLPKVIQLLKPWMSEKDINKGSRWSREIADQLDKADIGLISLTLENLDSPWILYEAGALSKTVGKEALVCPYLFGVKQTNIKGPLTQFQLTEANKLDTKKLVHTINSALDEKKLPEKELDEIYEVWWPYLEKKLKAIRIPNSVQKTRKPQRTDRELLEEILVLVRDVAKSDPSLDHFYEALKENLQQKGEIPGRRSEITFSPAGTE